MRHVYYCSNCCECLHSDCFNLCYKCEDVIRNHKSKCNHDKLCNSCDLNYSYEYKDEFFVLCAYCNPDHHVKGGMKKQDKLKEKQDKLKDLKECIQNN